MRRASHAGLLCTLTRKGCYTFKEFYRDAFTTPPDIYEETWTKAWEDRFPIHYHTWTYDSFMMMVELIIKSLKVYSNYWSHPTRGNEFCILLCK